MQEQQMGHWISYSSTAFSFWRMTKDHHLSLTLGILLFPDKDAVEKRLYVLQQQGYIYST
jgi:hypothetical protein